ncbi:MAG: cytochrome b [Proteobacteria bacterium]|nr:cytochrome b [Pseudomonadota bacterium]
MAPASFRPSQKALHWLIVVLVLTLYGMTYLEDLFARGSPARSTLWWAHISLGVGLIAAMVLRIVARAAFSAPALPTAMNDTERLAAKAAHVALYALLVAAPLLGVVTAWYRGMDVTFFGLISIPSPVGLDRAFSRTLQQAHNLAATALLGLAGLHALAALWHHYVRRDDVLTRMLPHRA